MKSVFVAGGALPPDSTTYVQRPADDEALTSALRGEYLHIVAPRQSGKTSLLKQVASHLKRTGWRCSYVDLSLLMDLPKPTWYAELGRALAGSLTSGFDPALNNQVDLRRYLLEQALPWPGGSPCLALLFDEIEAAGKPRDLDGNSFSDTFFMTLRNLFIQRDDYDGVIVVAFAGSVNPADLVKDPAISPFNVGVEIDLEDLSAAETRRLTDHLVELNLPVDDGIHHRVFEWTGGHPYLTQRVCLGLEAASASRQIAVLAPQYVDSVVDDTFLKPRTPLKRDSSIRHVAKMLEGLSPSAAQIWTRIRNEQPVARGEISEDIYLELYLTGAVVARDEKLTLRNRIYEQVFGARPISSHTWRSTDPIPRGMTMINSVRVFISSTWQDLQAERESVEAAILRMRDAAFAGMEYFGSRPETPRDASLAEVDRSDIYVGIFAHRYGSGITEVEYRRARQRQIPCLIYMKDDTVPVPPAHIERDSEKVKKLEALKDELKRNHTISLFRTADDLAAKVVADLHNQLRDTAGSQPAASTQVGPKYQISIGTAQGVVIGDGAQVTQHFGTESKMVSAHMAAAASQQRRCEDLAENIKEILELIKQYEDQRRLADDPKAKRRAERELAELRRQLQECEAERQQLKCE